MAGRKAGEYPRKRLYLVRNTDLHPWSGSCWGSNQTCRTTGFSHGGGRPTLIFCYTRGSAQETCRYLVRNKHMLQNQHPADTLDHSIQATRSSTILYRMALHSIMLVSLLAIEPDSEQLFKSGSIHILFSANIDDVGVGSTSTLGIGINLPAYMVIVKGTKGYVDAGNVEYSASEILQFIGRAGRPQFGNSGKAIILTESFNVDKYRDLVTGQEVLESNKLAEVILCNCDKQVFKTASDIVEWLSKTFFAVRIRKKFPEGAIHGIVKQEISALTRTNLLTEVDGGIGLTDIGKCVAKYRVNPIAMAKMLEAMPEEPSYQQIFEGICGSDVFDDLKITAGQKGVLNGMSKAPGLPLRLKGRIQDIRDKVLVLLQYRLLGKDIPYTKYSAGLSRDMSRAIQMALGPAKCIRDYYADKRDRDGIIHGSENVSTKHIFFSIPISSGVHMATTTASLRSAREISARCFESCSAVLQQLDGVGPRYAEIMWSNNIQSVTSLLSTNAWQIEYLLTRNPPFGTKVLSAAASIPSFSAKVFLDWIDADTVVFTIEVGCEYRQRLVAGTDNRHGNDEISATVLAHTSDGVLLKYEAISFGTASAFYATQAGLCNPSPGSSVIVEVASERHVGCEKRVEVPIRQVSSAATQQQITSNAPPSLAQQYDDIIIDSDDLEAIVLMPDDDDDSAA
ncbi:hypothetical protein DL89DRAFT_306116 [Linderina pennispora]|uniref:SEC63 domain-containing protein n=1 Tax=Linderina pennispora TaxID=61395 RepID=A0A1Y1VZ14_9FUNG|nr:uncharacterized protein DL89DRAFT_306116 [Linderina pennispora]ORX66508.1 hypothetical protein DL89DRAFT_306116 [Linderina pennispora]